jgi:hypothetical protein
MAAKDTAHRKDVAHRKDMAHGTAADQRHVYGPRPIAALVPGLTRAAFRRRSPGTAQVLADWGNIVGPALAAVTVPRRLTAGILTIACSGPIAMELQHLSGELIGRINTALGTGVVKALRFVQTAPAPATAARPPQPSPESVARAESATESLPPGELRDALTALGRAVFGAAGTGASTRRTATR